MIRTPAFKGRKKFDNSFYWFQNSWYGLVASSMSVNLIVIYYIVPGSRDFLPIKIFFKYCFDRLNNLCFQLPQNVAWSDEITRLVRNKWGKISSSYLFSEKGDLSFLLYISKQCLEGNIQWKFHKKLFGNFYFMRNHRKPTGHRQNLKDFSLRFVLIFFKFSGQERLLFMQV